jgi:hypothetical protein
MEDSEFNHVISISICSSRLFHRDPREHAHLMKVV